MLEILNNYPWTRPSVRIIGVIKRQFFHIVTHVFDNSNYMETRLKVPIQFKHVSDSAPSSFDTREHFDDNIASLTGIVISCSVSSSCNDRSNH